jgi:CRISPR/Cas system-associated endonuclease Cas3-HD
MKVQVSTDNHIHNSQELTEWIEQTVEESLSRFSRRITRVEVHLTDESGAARSRDLDKRCVLEARLAGLQPITVSHDADSVDHALHGATQKLTHSLESTLGRLNDPRT